MHVGHRVRMLFALHPEFVRSMSASHMTPPTLCSPVIQSHPCRNLCLGSLGGLLRVDLLAILVVSDSWGGSTVSAAFSRSHTHDLAVDSAGHAVLELEVHLGDGVVGEDRRVRDITCKKPKIVRDVVLLIFWTRKLFEGFAYGWRPTRPCCGS